MDNESKICQLWRYLKIQDDEILVIPIYNKSLGVDEYAIAEKNQNKISIRTIQKMPELSLDKPFHLFQHIGAEGFHTVPSVEQLKRDEEMDY